MAIWSCHPIDCNRLDEVKKAYCFAMYKFTLIRFKFISERVGFDHVSAAVPADVFTSVLFSV